MFKSQLNKIANPYVRSVTEWLLTIVLAFLLFLFIRNFLFRLANVNGNSMEPTLQYNDMVVLSRFSYYFSPPQAGDIIAFPFRENPSEFFIKRIVGLPGDVINYNAYHQLFTVNGKLLDDLPIPVQVTGDIDFPLVVPEDSYFILGDNRNGSKDSRYSSVGCIAKKEIVGKVVLRIYPFYKWGAVD